MYDGYALALNRGTPVSFRFRGVETTLYPDQLEVDDNLIKIRMKEVENELKKLSHVSSKINIVKKNNLIIIYFLCIQNFKIPSVRPPANKSARKPDSNADKHAASNADKEEATNADKQAATNADKEAASKPASKPESWPTATARTASSSRTTLTSSYTESGTSSGIGAPVDEFIGDGEPERPNEDEPVIELKEEKEKNRLLLALVECDQRIQKFESCVLKISNNEEVITLIDLYYFPRSI